MQQGSGRVCVDARVLVLRIPCRPSALPAASGNAATSNASHRRPLLTHLRTSPPAGWRRCAWSGGPRWSASCPAATKASTCGPPRKSFDACSRPPPAQNDRLTD